MADPTWKMQHGLKPYGDGSGFEYTLGVEVIEDEASVTIKTSSDAAVSINAEDWQDVAQVISDMLRFANGGRPKQ